VRDSSCCVYFGQHVCLIGYPHAFSLRKEMLIKAKRKSSVMMRWDDPRVSGYIKYSAEKDKRISFHQKSQLYFATVPKWFLRMLSFASIFGDDVKRKYLSAQNFRLHFLLMLFEAGSLHLSNCILVLGYGEPSTCSYRLRSSRTTPAANTG
jgi:hypothetical protein